MKKQSTSKGFAILGTSSIIVKVLAIIYIPIQTIIVGNVGNGVISDGYKLYTFIYSLTNVGLPVVISKLVSEQVARGDYRSSRKILKCAFTVLLVLGIVSSFVMFFGAHWLAVVYCKEPRAQIMIQALAPTFLFTCISCTLRGYFQGRQNMTPTAISQIIEQLLNTVLTVLFVWLLYNAGMHSHADAIAYGAAGSTVGTSIGALGAACFLVFIFWFVFSGQRQREYRHQLYDGPELSNSKIYREIIKYAIPSIISTIATSAIDLIDVPLCKRRLIAGGYTDNAAQALFGIYSNQYQRLFTLAIALTTPLVTAMIPAISSALARQDQRQFRRKISESYKTIFLVMIPSIAGLTFLAKPILTVVFFHNNMGSDLVIFGTWTAILMGVNYIQSGILIAVGKPLIAPVNTIIGMGAKILCNYYLISVPSINIKGAIVGNAVGWIIALILNQIAIKLNIPEKTHNTRYMIMPLCASVIMGFGCLVTYKFFYRIFGMIHPGIVANDISVMISVFLGIVVYFTLLIKLGGISAADIQRLPMGGRICRVLRKMPFLRRELQIKSA